MSMDIIHCQKPLKASQRVNSYSPSKPARFNSYTCKIAFFCPYHWLLPYQNWTILKIPQVTSLYQWECNLTQISTQDCYILYSSLTTRLLYRVHHSTTKLLYLDGAAPLWVPVRNTDYDVLFIIMLKRHINYVHGENIFAFRCDTLILLTKHVVRKWNIFPRKLYYLGF